MNASSVRVPRPAAATVALVALAGLTGAFGLLGCKKSAAAPAEVPVETVSVDTVKVREQPMPRSMRLTGTLRGGQETDLAANTTGRVLATFVERGAEVKKGDRLATLDTRNAVASVNEVRRNIDLARAQAEAAKRDCALNDKLFAQNVISAAERDRVSDTCRNADISVQVAEARARTLGIALADGTIVAPFAGMVTERHVSAGEYVRTDSKVVTLVSVDALRLEFTVPEANLAAVKEGRTLSFSVPAYPDRTFQGTVRFVGAAVRETTRDLVAEAVVENAERLLRPGMFATVALLTGEAPAPVLPKAALVRKEDGTSHVFAVVNKRLEERVVQTGSEKGEEVAILRGVGDGDAIVLSPSPSLRNGQAVN
ncbi:efflux RND transporter periplasmic adaptor subunit [Chondromyces apiculatus]|uniref:Efflux transporter, RND family, MFP subunit n=1 Tax=Chondromyces apiculatus DSM 436 TaxID=1192034 RepID=A0A017TAX2_9BACT|nr:efflux RND transporter periplasmic adaptor subunit [Chondromyces apiculatus]EYF06394.1 efflux transporter, RND family, MFP subunit [Chondromyces apiculatus DSM 436]